MITAAMATMATVDTRPCYPCGLFVYIAGSPTDPTPSTGYPTSARRWDSYASSLSPPLHALENGLMKGGRF